MSRTVITAVFTALLASGQSAFAAFSVDQTGGALDIKGPVLNDGDSVMLWGTSPGKLHVFNCGAYLGAFNSVKHVKVRVWGKHNVVVRLVDVQIEGDATIQTGKGSDDVLLVYNDIGSLVTIDTGAGDDMVDAQHNSFSSQLYIGTAKGDDETRLYDNDIGRDTIIETGHGDDDIRIGYNHPSPVYPANRIKGDLYVDGGDDTDAFEIAFGAIAGDAVLDTGPGESEVLVRESDFRGKLSLATSAVPSTTSVEVASNAIAGNATLNISGSLVIKKNDFRGDLSLTAIGGSHLQFLTNIVELDTIFDLGTEHVDLQYIYFEDRNQFRGDLAIHIGDSAKCYVFFLENIVEHDMVMLLASSGSGQAIELERNQLHGNVHLDSTGSVSFYLQRNSVKGALSVNTSGGADSVDLLRNKCDADVMIEVAGGNDEVTLGPPANDFNADLVVKGGAGTDTLFHDPANFYATPPSWQGFESIIP